MNVGFAVRTEKGPENDRVRVHDHHMTGKFLGAAHNKCNLARAKRKNERLPIMFNKEKVIHLN